MKTDTGAVSHQCIEIALTPHEAFLLWLAIDESRNALARSVGAELATYARKSGVRA